MKTTLHVEFTGVLESEQFFKLCCSNNFSAELRFREVVVKVKSIEEVNKLFNLQKSVVKEISFTIDAFYSKRCKRIIDTYIYTWPSWFMYRRGETIAYYKSWRHFSKTGKVGEFYETKVI